MGDGEAGVPMATKPARAGLPSISEAIGVDAASVMSVSGVEMRKTIHREPAITRSRPAGVSSS